MGLRPIPIRATATTLAGMSNTLLDFVMALVRDPDAAARYAADPVAALAGAELPGVTVADVQSLIPVVADSLAVATPDFGRAADVANVWTSGAAAAAFDAFDVAPAATVLQHVSSQVNIPDDDPVVESSGERGPADAPVLADTFDQPSADSAAQVWPDDSTWQSAHELDPTDHHGVDHSSFDLF